jgi:hypothetical protein
MIFFSLCSCLAHRQICMPVGMHDLIRLTYPYRSVHLFVACRQSLASTSLNTSSATFPTHLDGVMVRFVDWYGRMACQVFFLSRHTLQFLPNTWPGPWKKVFSFCFVELEHFSTLPSYPRTICPVRFAEKIKMKSIVRWFVVRENTVPSLKKYGWKDKRIGLSNVSDTYFFVIL